MTWAFLRFTYFFAWASDKTRLSQRFSVFPMLSFYIVFVTNNFFSSFLHFLFISCLADCPGWDSTSSRPRWRERRWRGRGPWGGKIMVTHSLRKTAPQWGDAEGGGGDGCAVRAVLSPLLTKYLEMTSIFLALNWKLYTHSMMRFLLRRVMGISECNSAPGGMMGAPSMRRINGSCKTMWTPNSPISFCLF